MVDGEQRMTGEEVIAEVEWLLGGAVSPLLIPSLLGRSPEAIHKMMRDYGREDLAAPFSTQVWEIKAARTTEEQAARIRARKRLERQARRVLSTGQRRAA